MDVDGNDRPTAEQVVLHALEELAADRNYRGGDLDLVMPEVAAAVVVAALRQAGMLDGCR